VAARPKRTKSKKAAPPVSLPQPVSGMPPLNIDWTGASETREIKRSNPAISKYHLEDGSVISVKPMVTDVRRALKQFNQFGEPLYFVTLTFSLNTKAPKGLHRPPVKTITQSKKKKK
jgi:hypothetical protein